MIQDMADDDIDSLLQRHLYGHLGCTTPDDRPYVVPVTYAYRDGCIYGFSFPGWKVNGMRKHPGVCFQVEEFLHEGRWRSVIVWGTYEELTDAQELVAAKLLFQSLEWEIGTATSPLYKPPPHTILPAISRALEEKSAIFYRIRIEQKTGKNVHSD